MGGEKLLEGRTAFITGGAGGIGSSSAKLLLRDGAAVLLMDLQRDALERTRAALLAEVPDGQIVLHVGDAGDADDVQAGLNKGLAIRGRLDILVPTVGGGAFRPILLHDAETFRRELDLNVITAFLAIRYGVPLMNGGTIVCISSTVALLPFPWLSGYCTAKGALEQFVRTAADEFASAGIRVNAVRPGVTRTEMSRSMFEVPAIIDSFLAQIPLGRPGEPDEIARGVRFLAGSESGFITGQSIAIDGGNELRRNPDLTAATRALYGSEIMDAVQRGRNPLTASAV